MNQANFKRIDPNAARALIEQGATIADIRDEASFGNGHIRGAQHLSNANIQGFIEDNDLDAPLIVCCYHGNSSQPAADFLAERGFDCVYSLDGGFEAWSQQHPDLCSRD